MAIKNSDEEPKVPKSTGQPPAERHERIVPPVPIVPVTSIPPSIPPVLEASGDSHRENNYRLNQRQFKVAKWTLFVLAIYTGIAAYQACQMRRATQAATSAADTAQNAYDLTTEAVHLDQRSWIGPTEAAAPQFKEGRTPVYLKVGQQSTFEVILGNFGKTPAKNIDERVSFRTMAAGVPFTPKYPTGPDRIGVIQPGSRLRWAAPPTETATKQQIETYRSGANVLYVFGEITYDDIFGEQRHHTTFCMYLLKDLSTFVDCKTYNNAD